MTDPGGRVTISKVDGEGTIREIKTGSARRVAADDQVGQQIRCGVSGAVCYSERGPQDKVRMRAQPGPGSGSVAGPARARDCPRSARSRRA
jgi:hypothetical protein